MNITLGSNSKHKISAVEEALKQLNIHAVVGGFSTKSGQNEQPLGMDQTLKGAITRAEATRTQTPENISIGIESGILHSSTEAVTLDIAFIVVLCPDGRRIITTSNGVQFPEEDVSTAAWSGYETTTVGSMTAKRLGGDATDPHSVLTDGQVTRTETLVTALVIALKQAYNLPAVEAV